MHALSTAQVVRDAVAVRDVSWGRAVIYTATAWRAWDTGLGSAPDYFAL